MAWTQEAIPHTVLDAGHTWPQSLRWNMAKLSELAPTPVCWANSYVMPVPTAFLGRLGLKPEAPPHPGWGLHGFSPEEGGGGKKKMELARETEEGHVLHPAQIPALGNAWQASLVPSTASQEWTLTFLSRNEAIRPKFLGCCMNLEEEKDRR